MLAPGVVVDVTFSTVYLMLPLVESLAHNRCRMHACNSKLGYRSVKGKLVQCLESWSARLLLGKVLPFKFSCLEL